MKFKNMWVGIKKKILKYSNLNKNYKFSFKGIKV